MLQNLTQNERSTNFLNEQKLRALRYNALSMIADILLDNKLCKSIGTNGRIEFGDDWWCTNRLSLVLFDYDLPTVIDHVAGPFHRHFKADWKLDLPYEDLMVLSTSVPSPIPQAFSERIYVQIRLYERDMRSCQVVKVVTREKTEEEIKEALMEAADRNVYAYKIDCAA